MIKIKTFADLTSSRDQQTLPQDLITSLEKYFRQLHEALSDGEDLEDFSLERHGYFVILEPSDDVRNLREVGLNPTDDGFLGSWPEYVEKVTDEWYKVAVLYDNEYMMFFFLRPSDFDDEVKAWLTEQTEENRLGIQEAAASCEEN